MAISKSGIIYCYTSPSGKQYIGQTWNEIKRKNDHKNGRRKCAFYDAIKKYGIDNFKYELLHESDNQQELDFLEDMEIMTRNTLVPNGYNIRRGGSHGKHSEASKKLSSISHKGKKLPGVSIANRGRRRTEEQRRAQSKRTKGANNPRAVKVLCLETGIIYSTVKEAAEKINCRNKAGISKCCKRGKGTVGGFHWTYA